MKRFAAMLAVSVLMVLWIASGDRMSAGQRTDGLYYEVTGIHPDAVLMRINGEDISAEADGVEGVGEVARLFQLTADFNRLPLRHLVRHGHGFHREGIGLLDVL